MGLYRDLKGGNCNIIENDYNIPIFDTKQKGFSPIDSGNTRIILTILSSKRKLNIGRREYEDLKYSIVATLEKNNISDNYFLVCIVAGSVDVNFENKISHNNINTIILDQNSLVDLFDVDGRIDVPDRFGQKLIESRSIFEKNPYETENPTSPETGIYVERNSLFNSIVRGKKSYALYGARRIGKSSLLKHLNEYYSSQSDCEVVHVSVASAKVRNIDFKNIFKIGIKILDRINDPKMVYNTQESYKLSFEKYLSKIKKKGKTFVLLIDEIDIYLKTLKKEHQQRNLPTDFGFFQHLRDLKNDFNIKLVVAGFMNLYDQIHSISESSSLQNLDSKTENPFAGGLFETEPVNYLSKDNSLRLINTLESKLALSIKGSDVTADYIFRKTTGHPALIQYFLSNLIKNISKRVDSGDRKIYRDDIDKVAKTPAAQDGSFIKFANEKFFLNLKRIDALIICVMAELSEEYKEIPKHQVLDKLKYKLKSFPLNTKHEDDLGFPSLDNPSHWISDDNEGKKLE